MALTTEQRDSLNNMPNYGTLRLELGRRYPGDELVIENVGEYTCGKCRLAKKCGLKELQRKHRNWSKEAAKMRQDFIDTPTRTQMNETVQERCEF